MDPRLVVEMPFVGQGASNANSAGWLRDSDYFWKELSARYPEAFSQRNLDIIGGNVTVMGKNGKVKTLKAPSNDETFRSVFTQYDVKGLRGTQLIHHHIGGGGQAAAVPRPLHPGFGGIHNAEKQLGIWDGEQSVSDLLQQFIDRTN
jgi:hypothetical protein